MGGVIHGFNLKGSCMGLINIGKTKSTTFGGVTTITVKPRCLYCSLRVGTDHLKPACIYFKPSNIPLQGVKAVKNPASDPYYMMQCSGESYKSKKCVDFQDYNPKTLWGYMDAMMLDKVNSYITDSSVAVKANVCSGSAVIPNLAKAVF